MCSFKGCCYRNIFRNMILEKAKNYWLPDLSERYCQPELMDFPESDTTLLYRTLDQFEHINDLFSAYKRLTRKYFLSDMITRGKKEYRVADIGSGGGDYARWLVKECRKRGITTKVTCIDSDKRVIDYAVKKCSSFPEITILHRNVTDPQVWRDPYDYAYANHFLHHFATEKIPGLLSLIDRNIRNAFLINDIYRSPGAYVGFTLICALLFRKSFAFYDGRLSIRKGFRLSELQSYVDKANLPHHTYIRREWPARCVVFGGKS
ncbi:MAG: methyltransferase domain-containing protein [Chitinivibrionales bacterium]|nr:methyltransferase domain-containing protein [Chitinivibrionales bacterium]